MKEERIKTIDHRVFCPACGELKISEDGEIEHPELDKVYARRLLNGFTTTYAN